MITYKDQFEAIGRASALINDAKKITVLTGAGISTDSGIPDFRGPNGIWTKNPEAEKASDIRFYIADPEIRKRNWQLRASGEMWPEAIPNDGHRALVHLEKRGLLHALVTQNVDGLHETAGNSRERIIEIHGTTRRAMCLSCEWRDDIEVILERVRSGDEDPKCDCGGLLKSATVSFGQNLFPQAMERMQKAAVECDLMIAIGTTLTVYPVAQMVPIALENGASIIIVNGEKTAMDAMAKVVVNAPISDVLPIIMNWSNEDR